MSISFNYHNAAFCKFEIPRYSLAVVNTDGFLQRSDILVFYSEVNSVVHRHVIKQNFQWYFLHYMRFYFLKTKGVIEPKGYVV